MSYSLSMKSSLGLVLVVIYRDFMCYLVYRPQCCNKLELRSVELIFTFLLRSFRVTSQIFLKTVISNTLSLDFLFVPPPWCKSLNYSV